MGAFIRLFPPTSSVYAAVQTLSCSVDEETTAQELEEIKAFKTQTLQLYLTILDGRSSSVTLISVLRLARTNMFFIYNIYL